MDAVVDQGSFVSWDTEPEQPVVSAARDLSKARERSMADESVITGAGLIRGRRVALIVSEFSFLAGSIGHAAAQRIVAAVERATAERDCRCWPAPPQGERGCRKGRSRSCPW